MFFGNRRSQFERRTTVSVPLGALLVIGAGLLGPVAGAAQGCPRSAAIPGPAGGELIPYEKFTLANGLTVVVHTDRKAPIVAVNVWYHVGSKDEPPGKTGFAHLFEHLMFQGSENYNDEYFKPFEQVGATSMNGTTSFDRTNYFQNVPTTALDMALWMESDRMGHLLGAIDQAAARRAARRGPEREAPGREPALRPRVRDRVPRELPAGPSLPHAADRLDGRPQRRVARRRAGLVPHLLRRGQRGAGAGRRHRRGHRAREGASSTSATSRRAPPSRGPGVDRRTHRQPSRDDVRPGRRSRAGSASGTRRPTAPRDSEYLGARRRDPGRRQDLAPLRASRVPRADGRQRRRGPVASSRSPGSSRSRPTSSRASRRARRGGDRGGTAALHRRRARRKAELERARTRCAPASSAASSASAASAARPTCSPRARSTQAIRAATAGRCEWIEAATPSRPAATSRGSWLAQGDYTLEVRPSRRYAAAATDVVDRKPGPPVTDEFPDIAFPDAAARAAQQRHAGHPCDATGRAGGARLRCCSTAASRPTRAASRAPRASRWRCSTRAPASSTRSRSPIARNGSARRSAQRRGARHGVRRRLDADRAGWIRRSHCSPTWCAARRFPQHEIERVREEWIAGIAREKTSPDALAHARAAAAALRRRPSLRASRSRAPARRRRSPR